MVMKDFHAHQEGNFSYRRLRRNRSTSAWRRLVEESSLSPGHLILPLFVTEQATRPIESMPGIFRHNLMDAQLYIERACRLGIMAVNLFCHVSPDRKDAYGSEAFRDGGLFARAIRTIRSRFPEVLLCVDIALDPYTSHGFDGLLDTKGEVANDPTVERLVALSLVAAHHGADIVAPSDMMDGRVRAIRLALDQEGFSHVGILSYAVKFASHLYSPFRDALESAPRKGDKKSFQVNVANQREAILECLVDEDEGADMLLIKPGLPSLDIIALLREKTLLPIGAYQVSGEYSMIQAAADRGWINREAVLLESLLAIRRAGADFICTYAALDVAPLLSG